MAVDLCENCCRFASSPILRFSVVSEIVSKAEKAHVHDECSKSYLCNVSMLERIHIVAVSVCVDVQPLSVKAKAESICLTILQVCLMQN